MNTAIEQKITLLKRERSALVQHVDSKWGEQRRRIEGRIIDINSELKTLNRAATDAREQAILWDAMSEVLDEAQIRAVSERARAIRERRCAQLVECAK